MPPALPPSVNATDNDPALPALLAEHSAWSLLDASARAALAPQWQQRPMAPGEVLLPQGELHTRLGMVLAGSVTLRDPDLGHAVQLQRGQMFGFGATPERHLATWQAQAATGGAVAWLAPEVLQQLCRQHGALEYHFASLPQAEGTAAALPTSLASPADTSASLLARAIVPPCSIAAITGPSPAQPTIAATVRSTGLAALGEHR